MKSKFKIFIFLISCLFLLPISASCKSYISDYTEVNNNVDFIADEFTINMSKYESNIENEFYLLGGAYKNISDVYYYHYIIYLYDENKEEIGAFDGYNGIWSDNKINQSTVDISVVNNVVMNAKYYKFFVEPSTKELVTNYLYNDTKINSDALDPISDTDTTHFKIKTNSKIDSTIYNNMEYIIKGYDINITVNEDNSYLIKESITAYFNVAKHGIFRKIPLKNIVVRNDGSKSSNRAKITNIKISDPYSSSVENGNRVLKIGDSDVTLTGEKEYIIEYLYNIGKDPSSKFDELYFNIIGLEWDTYIENVTFTITMPKEFDKEKLGFTAGYEGSTNNDGITYEVNGNIITGKYNKPLEPAQGITVRLELPEGYFVEGSYNFDGFMLIMLIVPIIGAFIAYYLWNKHGKDEQVVETVEFYPPEGLNSAEVGFFYSGTSTNKGVISLLIYLANKGYLKIKETEVKGVFGNKKSFEIEKIKEYDGNNTEEKLFFEGLFKPKYSFGSKTVENKNIVTESDLYNNFYVTLNAINSNYNKKSSKERIFEKNSINKGFIIFLISLINICIITIRPIIEYGDLEILIPAILFPLVASFAIAGVFMMVNNKNVDKQVSQIIGSIIAIVWIGIFGCVFFIALILPALLIDPLYVIIYIVGFISTIIVAIFGFIMEKRNAFGREMLGKIGGFRKFLITAEKARLEALVEKDPEYFFNILPYTYALGVSDKWVKQFESIQVEAPNWYVSTSAFDIATFSSFMNDTMSQAESSMSSSPSSSSGGGSSGGGSGGGGGGSW